MWTSALLWVISAAVYLLFAGRLSADEIAAGALCGLLASRWSLSLREIATLRFHFAGSEFAAFGRALTGLPQATLQVAAQFLRTVATGGGGRISATPFTQGRRDDPKDSGRRAIAIFARSLAPDSFVLRIPENRDRIVAHDLLKPSPGDTRRDA